MRERSEILRGLDLREEATEGKKKVRYQVTKRNELLENEDGM